MAVRNIVRQWNEATEGYSYRFKGGDIFLRLVKDNGSYELRNPIGYDVRVIKCKDLDEADVKAKDVIGLIDKAIIVARRMQESYPETIVC